MLRCPIVGLDFGHTEFEDEHLQLDTYQGLRVFVDDEGVCHRAKPPALPSAEQTAFEFGCDPKTKSLYLRETAGGSFDQPKSVLFECFNLNGRSLCLEYGRHDVSGWHWTACGFEKLAAFDRNHFSDSSEAFLFADLDYELCETLMVNFWLDRESHCLIKIRKGRLSFSSDVGFFAGI